jgi:hypothetical protein
VDGSGLNIQLWGHWYKDRNEAKDCIGRVLVV